MKPVLSRIILALLLTLLLASTAMAEEDLKPAPDSVHGYVFDLTNRDITCNSKGTGGTNPYPDVIQHYDSTWRDSNESDPAITDSLQAKVDAWRKRALAVWGIRQEDEDQYDFSTDFQANNTLMLVSVACSKTSKSDFIQSYAEDNLFDNGLRYLQTALFDVARERQLKLSDLFYDGFNYIDYINTFIAEHPDDLSVHNYAETISYEDTQRRPFSGLPREYPLFTVHSFFEDNYLKILFDDDFPFWSAWSDTCGRDVEVYVPLNHRISPFGGCEVHVSMARRMLDNDIEMRTPIVKIDGGFAPDVDAKLNAALAAGADQLIPVLEKLEFGECRTWIEPNVSRSGHFALLGMNLCQWNEDGISTETIASYMLGLYDLHTGDPVPMDEVFALCSASAKAQYSTITRYDYIADSTQPGYAPPEGTRVWRMEFLTDYKANESNIRLLLTEPDGDKVQLIAPSSVLEGITLEK